MSRGRPHPRNARRTGRMRRDESSRRPTFRMLQSVFSAFHKLIPPPFCEFGHEPFVRSGDFVRAVRVIPNRLAHTGETLRANLMDPSKHLPQKEFGASTRTSFFFQPGTSTMIQSSLSQEDLLFFVTLCRLQSLTVSAQKLNLSLSSACRMLTHLRETFGEPLQPQRPHAHAGRHGPSAQGDHAA